MDPNTKPQQPQTPANSPQQPPPQGGIPPGMPGPMPQNMPPPPVNNVPAGYPPPPAGMPPQPNNMPPVGYPPQQGMPQTQYQVPVAGQGQPQGQVFGSPGLPQKPMPKRAKKINPNSTQNALQIAEIRDGIVIMNDGSFRSVVMLKSINFDLMSPEEREAVEFAYQGFLNSLYFPVQIFIHSQKVDLRPYLERLVKIRNEHDNMLLALLMDDYIAYMSAVSEQTNIMDKHFYLVIPYYPTADLQKTMNTTTGLFGGLTDLFSNKQKHVVINEATLNKAKDELRNRVQAVLSGLMQCGVQGLPLDTQELIELYYDTYNPDTATRQELKNFNDLVAPVITKGEGDAPTPGLDKEMLQ